MKRWKRQTRLGVIAVASFVLLVTVLPQLASGFGLGALANRLENVTTSCSGSSGSSGSSGGSASSGSSGSSGSSTPITPTPTTVIAGSSGSSGSGSSSQCAPPPNGTVTGTVTVTGAPAGFEPAYEGIGLCSTADSVSGSCTDPIDGLAENGVYTLSLAPGSYSGSGFYENNAYGGAFLGTGQTITIVSGQTLTLNLTVPYKAPAAVTGTVSVTGLPAGTIVQQLSVLMCPSYAPYIANSPNIACVNGYSEADLQGATSTTYEVTGLPPIVWTIYPSYCTQYGCETDVHHGQTVTLGPGLPSVVNVTASYIVPADGLLSATVSVPGAPAGAATSVAWTACPKSGATTSCQTFYASPGIAESILLASGSWTVTPYYLAAPFDNAVPGPSRTVTVTGGHTTNASLTVSYRAPGTAAGTVAVTGVPAGVSITSYTVVACPASAPLVPNSPSLECASEYSGPAGYGFGPADRGEKTSDNVDSRAPAGVTGAATAPYNVYKISSLTPGKWLLYPGYETDLSSYMATTGTPVTVAAGQTATRVLTVPYQKPTVGAVTGQVIVLDAPSNGFQSGAQACTAVPTTTSCPGEQEAFSEQGGTYELILSPGTWWISGVVQEFGTLTESQVSSAPVKVTVVAGVTVTENFVVQGS
jgi:hypothetical protein